MQGYVIKYIYIVDCIHLITVQCVCNTIYVCMYLHMYLSISIHITWGFNMVFASFEEAMIGEQQKAMKKLMKLAIVRKKHPKAKPEAKCALEASLRAFYFVILFTHCEIQEVILLLHVIIINLDIIFPVIIYDELLIRTHAPILSS